VGHHSIITKPLKLSSTNYCLTPTALKGRCGLEGLALRGVGSPGSPEPRGPAARG